MESDSRVSAGRRYDPRHASHCGHSVIALNEISQSAGRLAAGALFDRQAAATRAPSVPVCGARLVPQLRLEAGLHPAPDLPAPAAPQHLFCVDVVGMDAHLAVALLHEEGAAGADGAVDLTMGDGHADLQALHLHQLLGVQHVFAHPRVVLLQPHVATEDDVLEGAEHQITAGLNGSFPQPGLHHTVLRAEAAVLGEVMGGVTLGPADPGDDALYVDRLLAHVDEQTGGLGALAGGVVNDEGGAAAAPEVGPEQVQVHHPDDDGGEAAD